MSLPAPDDYKDWKEYARALVAVLAESTTDPEVFSYASRIPEPPPVVIPPPTPAYPPDGWFPVWYTQDQAELYLGNAAFSPPTAGALFHIDTGQIADAAVTTAQLGNKAVNTGKLADLAVTAAQLSDSSVTETKIANLAVGSAAIQALAVGTAHIANAAIISAKIADLQVVTAKIADLAVNDAKIANLAVTSAKIANLAVGVAHIQDAAIVRAKIAFAAIGAAQIEDAQVTNAKIGATIQSYNWNPANKAGWLIDKNGIIYGQGINIYDAGGNLVFGAGSGTIDWARVVGVGRPQDYSTVGAQSGVNIRDSLGNIQGDINLLNSAIVINTLGQLANIGTAGVTVDNNRMGIYGTTGQLVLTNNNVPTDAVNLAEAGLAAFAYLNMLNAANATTYIQNGAIGTAQIGLASITTALIGDAQVIQAKIGLLAVGTANIQDLAVTQAKIGYLAVGVAQIQDASISTAKIQDAAIANAKIGDLQVTTLKIGDIAVTTEKVNYSAVEEVLTFYSAYMGIPSSSPGVWYYLNYGGVYCMLTAVATTPNQQVLVDWTASLTRGGSSDDVVHFRVYRSDGVVLAQQYMNIRISQGNEPYSMTFCDPNPVVGASRAYYLQYCATQSDPSANTPQFGDVSLRLQLVKR